MLINAGFCSSFAVMKGRVPRSSRKIFEKHGGDIWDGADEEYRQQVSLDDLDNLGADDRIFTGGGFEIPRYGPVFENNKRTPCGVLVDFKRLGSNFRPDTRLRFTRAGLDLSGCIPYPQAGLVTAGHLQAKCLLPEFYPLIEAINVGILNASGEDVEEDLLVKDPRWPVYGISCQIYNAAMHQIRGIGSQHHEVVRGMVSGALGGQCIPNTVASDRARKLRRSCVLELPHTAHEAKASSPDICKDLRLENVYWVDLDQVAEENRSGR